MRRIVENSLVSVDGVVPDDPVGMGFANYYDDSYLRERLALFTMCDAILWGRSTYEVFSKMWSGKEKAHPYAARLIAIRKYVFSSTLKTADWNNSTIVRGDVVAEVSKLKQHDGGDLLVLGHGLFAETLLKHRLLDTIHLDIHPVLVGRPAPGRPFFREGQTATLNLTATKVFAKVVRLSYEPQ
jgi:dihydrofolate reductase